MKFCAGHKQEFLVFHRDCYQILLLISGLLQKLLAEKNHKSILPRKRFLHLGGGGGVTQERFSNLGNNQFFKRSN